MIYLKYALLSLSVFGFGLLSSGGVFTVFVSVGLVPRFADKTHTAAHIIHYENCIIWGAVLGCIASLYDETLSRWVVDLGNRFTGNWPFWGSVILGVFGMFAGMFVGCFAIAIAEMLNTIPISVRRVGIGRGTGIVLLCLALGKSVGSFLYYLLRLGY